MGGARVIKNEDDLKASWADKRVTSWLGDAGEGSRIARIHRYEIKDFNELKKDMDFYLNAVLQRYSSEHSEDSKSSKSSKRSKSGKRSKSSKSGKHPLYHDAEIREEYD